MKTILGVILNFIFIAHVASQEVTQLHISGYAVHQDSTPTYRALVSLGSTYSSLPSEMVSISTLKNQYKEALSSKGISWNKLSENPFEFGYETMGYENEGAIFLFETSSFSEMRLFLQVKSLGLQRVNSLCVFTIDSDEHRTLVQNAIQDAKAKAKVIAKATGKKLGAIAKIEDFNQKWGSTIENSLYYDRPVNEYKYSIEVTFNILE